MVRIAAAGDRGGEWEAEMSGEITRGGKWVKPSFDHYDHKGHTPAEACTSQMLESIRNILADLKNSQMLQCDVRQDIREIRLALQRKRRKPAKPNGRLTP